MSNCQILISSKSTSTSFLDHYAIVTLELTIILQLNKIYWRIKWCSSYLTFLESVTYMIMSVFNMLRNNLKIQHRDRLQPKPHMGNKYTLRWQYIFVTFWCLRQVQSFSYLLYLYFQWIFTIWFTMQISLFECKPNIDLTVHILVVFNSYQSSHISYKWLCCHWKHITNKSVIKTTLTLCRRSMCVSYHYRQCLLSYY